MPSPACSPFQARPTFRAAALATAALMAAALACAHPAARAAAPARAPAAPTAKGAAAAPATAPAVADPLPSALDPQPDLSPVRAGADAVLRAQAEGYWRLFTEGEAFDPAAPWKDRGELLSDATLAQVARAAREGAPGERRAAAFLSAWLVGERIAHDTAAVAKEVTRARDEARLLWGDHSVALRDLAAVLAAEKDPERRRALTAAAAPWARQLFPVAAAREERVRAAAAELGYGSLGALAAELRGAPLSALRAQAEDVLARTDATWAALLEALARADGLPRGEVRARDLPRLLRTQTPARFFPAGRQVGEASTLLAGMGIDLSRQANLHLAPGPQPRGLARAIALPVDPPGDVRLAIPAVAGLEAARAALHELGVAELYAHAAGGAPAELRRLGPAAIPAAFGILFEEVAGAPEWLTAHDLEAAQASLEARAAAARRLFRTRELAGRVLAAADRAEGVAPQDATLFTRVTGCPLEEADLVPWRLDPDPLLRASEGLLAELLAAQAELRLVRGAGATWWRAPASAGALGELWAAGAGHTPEELSQAIGEKALDSAALVKVTRARAGL